jgi:hypothetical protein
MAQGSKVRTPLYLLDLGVVGHFLVRAAASTGLDGAAEDPSLQFR